VRSRLLGQILRGAISLMLMSWTSLATAEEFVVPPLTGVVVDEAGILSASARGQIEQLSKAVFASGGSQIGVLTLPSLGGLSIEEVGIKVTDVWKLGRKGQDDGILLIIAPNERRVRIEVGRGREGDLTDAYSRRIINQILGPSFREGQFDRGVLLAVAAIIQKTDPNFDLEANGMPRSRMTRGSGQNIASNWVTLIVVLLFVLLGPVVGLLQFLGLAPRSHRIRSYGGSSWGGGSGWGGGSSGGSWSGGGGGFGGGGSSGQW
jgi:uncharacterized protein